MTNPEKAVDSMPACRDAMRSGHRRNAVRHDHPRGTLAAPALAVAAFAIALSGCTPFSRPQAVRETYLLQPSPPAAIAMPRPGSLRVGVIRVAAPFRGRDFVFRSTALRFESNYYFEFLVDPASMVTEGTARSLEAARPFAQVSAPGSGVGADWRLDGFVSALYADVRDSSQPAAELDITYYLIRADGGDAGGNVPVWTREYRQRTPMRDATPQAYAAALNAGFGSIVAELARDLAQAKLPPH